MAKAYRLLRAVLYTAVDDGLIRRNPCRIKGAGEDAAAERPVLGVDQVLAVAAAMPEHYRTLVLLATFTSLRFGELAALRRSDVDLDACSVHVRQSQAELSGGRVVVKRPKNAAGLRAVAIPGAILDDLRRRHGREHRGADDSDGPSSMRATFIYQHATSERDQAIAATVSTTIAAHRSKQAGLHTSAGGPG